MTRKHVIALIAVAALSVTGEGQATPATDRCEAVRAGTAKAPPSLPLPYRPDADTAPVLLRVAGVRYAIPANYFRYPPIGCDTEEGDLLLRVVLPGHLAYAPERKALFDSGRYTMNILLEVQRWGGSEPPPHRMNHTLTVYAPDVDRLADHPLWDGLLRTQDRDGQDVFFTRDGAGNVTFLMVCLLQQQPREPTRLATAPYPSCQQFFPYRGARVKQHFNRAAWLEQWREIRDGTVRVLDGFAAAGAAAPITRAGDAVGAPE